MHGWIALHGRGRLLQPVDRIAIPVLVLLIVAGWVCGGASFALAVPPAPVVANGSVQIGLSHPAPSPNGRDLAFVFAGDLWLTSIEGGTASRILSSPEQEARPFWSPDGRLLLFARHEGRTQNLFVLDRETGAVRRLTEHEAVDVPSGFSRDGRAVLFYSDRSGQNRVYEIDAEGGEPRPLIFDLSAEACWISSDELIFVRSRVPWWRQRARGVGAGELFRFSLSSRRPEALTSFEGVDLWPTYDDGGGFVYYASEESFTRNVWRVHLGSGVHTQVTTHRTGAADFPQVSPSGRSLFYEQGGSIWRVDLSADPTRREPSAAHQLEILCRPPVPSSPAHHITVGARGLWVGPESGSIVLEAEGQLFSRSIVPDPVADPGEGDGTGDDAGDDAEGGETERPGGRRLGSWKPLAPSSYREDAPSWSPHGDRLVLVSDRAGQQDLLYVESGERDVPVLSSATAEVVPFRSNFRNEYAPHFAPDGRFVAYLREYEEVEQLLLADPEGGREVVLTDGVSFDGMAFAPDGRWIAYSKRDRSGNAEIYLQSLFGGGEYNLSLHPADDVEPSWSADGRYLFFLSDRAGSRDVWAFALHQEDALAAGEGLWPEPQGGIPTRGVTVDLAGVADRVFQVTELFGDEHHFVISPNGSRIVFVSDVLGEPALWTRRWSGSEMERISRGWVPRVVRFDPSGDAVWILDELGVLRRCEFDMTDTDAAPNAKSRVKVEIIPFSLVAEIDLNERREQILMEAWRVLNDGFYRPHFHLLDWEATLLRYRDRLEGVYTDEDLNILIRRMMGELNASHLGLRSSPDLPRLATGWLGLEVEAERSEPPELPASTTSTGLSRPGRPNGRPGLRIVAVLPGGPVAGVGLQVGDRLLSVAGEPVGAGRPLESILRDRVGRETEIRWVQAGAGNGSRGRDAQGEEAARVIPVDTDQIRGLERLRSVHAVREQILREAGSNLGYVRLDQIDRPHLDALERELRVRQVGRDGLILDLRNNLGGDLPEEFLRVLQIRSAVWRESRGERRRAAPDPLWTEPLVVLIGPDTGSAAEIVAQGISELGLGVLLGEPTAGGVIGAQQWELVDGRQLRVPHVGWATSEGDNLEGRGVEPDIWIEETFERNLVTRDATIHAAIRVLNDEITKAGRVRRTQK